MELPHTAHPESHVERSPGMFMPRQAIAVTLRAATTPAINHPAHTRRKGSSSKRRRLHTSMIREDTDSEKGGHQEKTRTVARNGHRQADMARSLNTRPLATELGSVEEVVNQGHQRLRYEHLDIMPRREEARIHNTERAVTRRAHLAKQLRRAL